MMNGTERKLVAIMFTDMVGYTALMREDETNAKRIRDKHRSVLRVEVSKFNGQILQFYGDGTLSIFSSAIEAARAAIQIQLAFQQDPKIPVRIGLHLGDIVHDEDGVYGDGVNVASRVESLAVSGSILVSDKIFDELKGHPDLPAVPLGVFELKNVDKPARIYALKKPGLVVPAPDQISGLAQLQEKRIAVLPLANLSGDPGNEYLSDGLAEELINALVKVSGLQVTSRTSSFAFREKQLDIREIGKALEVDYLLEGSLRVAGNRIRITGQLINAVTGYHLWSETFTGEMEDIFEFQDEISKKIANSLKAALSLADKERTIYESITTNVVAYNHYLKGVYYYNKFKPTAVTKSIGHLNKAIQADPDYALAYAKLADAYTMLGSVGFMPADQALSHAAEYSRKAVEKDQNLVEGCLAVASMKAFLEWDFDGAFQALQHALSLQPASADVHYLMSLYNLVMLDFRESLIEIKLANKLDPLSPSISRAVADIYYFTGQYEQAIEQYDATLKIDQSYSPAVEFKAWAFLMKGEIDVAIELFQSLDSSQYLLKVDAQLGYAYGRKGDLATAGNYLKRMQENPDTKAMDLATIHMGMGDSQHAIRELKKALADRIGGIILLHASPIWRPLHGYPEFQDLVHQIVPSLKFPLEVVETS